MDLPKHEQSIEGLRKYVNASKGNSSISREERMENLLKKGPRLRYLRKRLYQGKAVKLAIVMNLPKK